MLDSEAMTEDMVTAAAQQTVISLYIPLLERTAGSTETDKLTRDFVGCKQGINLICFSVIANTQSIDRRIKYPNALEL